MTKEERLTYIDVSLRISNIELSKLFLEKIVKIIDLVDEEKGKTDIKDLIKLKL